MTTNEFKTAMQYLYGSYGKSEPAGKILSFWYEDYKDVDDEVFMKGIRKLIDNEEKLPKKATIDRYVKGSSKSNRKFFSSTVEDWERTFGRKYPQKQQLACSNMKEFDINELIALLTKKMCGQMTLMDFYNEAEKLTGVDFTAQKAHIAAINEKMALLNTKHRLDSKNGFKGQIRNDETPNELWFARNKEKLEGGTGQKWKV